MILGFFFRCEKPNASTFLQGTQGLWEIPHGYLVWGFGTSVFIWIFLIFFKLGLCFFHMLHLFHTKSVLLCHIQHCNMLTYSFKAILLNFQICRWAFVSVFSIKQIIFTASHYFWLNMKCEQWLIMNYGLHAMSWKSTWKLNWAYLLRAH